MRVALINEGGYPYRAGPVATWCHRLVRGLDEHDFHLATIVEAPTPRACPPLVNTPTLTPIPLTGRAVAPAKGPPLLQHQRAATHAAVLLCRGMLEETAHGAAMFRSALRRLAGLAADGIHPLVGVPLPAVLLDAWRAAGGAGTGGPGAGLPVAGRPPAAALPRPTLRDGQIAADLMEAATRALSTPVPAAELTHAVDGGLATLVALGAKWRAGVPYVVTEHDLYLHGPLMRRAGARPAVRAVLLRFLRALTRLGYAEAAAIVPPSERMRRWAMHHGAARNLIRVVPPGVDPHDHPVLRDEPDEPAVVWVGPETELSLIMTAFTALRRSVPQARLIVIGSAPEGQRPEGVSFTGPVTARRSLYAMGRAVAISGAHEAMPYPMIESMLCGRATVCTDNGGLTGTVGVGALVVPPKDPTRLAAACATVLTDDRLRRELATAGRHRARTLFSLTAMLTGYRAVYEQARARRPEPDDRLVLPSGVS